MSAGSRGYLHTRAQPDHVQITVVSSLIRRFTELPARSPAVSTTGHSISELAGPEAFATKTPRRIFADGQQLLDADGDAGPAVIAESVMVSWACSIVNINQRSGSASVMTKRSTTTAGETSPRAAGQFESRPEWPRAGRTVTVGTRSRWKSPADGRERSSELILEIRSDAGRVEVMTRDPTPWRSRRRPLINKEPRGRAL